MKHSAAAQTVSGLFLAQWQTLCAVLALNHLSCREVSTVCLRANYSSVYFI